ncbi:Ulp1 protease family, carboxy-terminal domain protein [Arachis hypogaea]|nr:Ulp1 protease family, carboxy-terminal domain protein [Arachis hypogaea]
MAPPPADAGYWSIGIPNLFSNISSMKTPTTLSNKVESTTGLVGLYASGPSNGKPNKLAKIEQTGSTTMEGSPLTGLNLTQSGKPERSGSRRPLLRWPGPRHDGPSSNSQKFVVLVVPMSHDMQFRLILDMRLSIEQCKLATYVFAKCGEVLFHFAEFEIPRGMFFSLIPPWTPHTDIINAWCMLVSMKCSKSIAPRVWFFPSHFAADVLREVAIKQLKNKYEYKWMPKTSHLEHVFVLVLEPADGWYLMLLNIKALKVYVLDVCHDDESKLFMTERNVVNSKHGSCDPSAWKKFNYPKDIPNELGSEEIAVWCLYWLQQEGGFSTKIFSPSVRGLVEAKAEHLWHDITTNKE